MRGLRAGSWTRSPQPAGAPDIAASIRAGRRPQTTQLVVCAGDSLTRGRSSASRVEILQPRLAPGGYEFVNAGVDGDLAWNVLARIGDVIRCEPDIVTLLAGSNDVIATSSAFPEKMYRRLRRLPHAPTLDWYTRCLGRILTRPQSQACARIAVLDIPLIGEDLASDMNHRVDSCNQALRRVAAAHAVRCLPLHDRLTTLARRTQPPALHRSAGPVIRASLSHHVLRRSRDQISAASGLAALTDHVHLNDRAAALAAALVTDFITADPQQAAHRHARG